MYRVKASNQRIDFQVDASQSLIQGAQEQQVSLAHGCGNGHCGACKVYLEQGDIEYFADYQPTPLTQQECESGMILCCMASAKSDLLIRIPESEDYPVLKEDIYQSRVVSKKQLDDDIYQLILSIEEEKSLQFYPGQYIKILGDDQQSRCFSIAGGQSGSKIIELHIAYQKGGLFSEQLKQQLKTNSPITFSGPYGYFLFPKSHYHDVIFVAGGTGIAPIKSILETHLEHFPPQFNISLFWGAQKASQLYLDEQFKHWQQHYEFFSYTPVLSKANAQWSGKTGEVHESVIANFPDLSEHKIYIAGPPGLIDRAKQLFPAFKANEENLFFDAFESPVKGKKTGFRQLLKNWLS